MFHDVKNFGICHQKLKVGTLFSGIGAFEQALKLLNLPHEIEFACDNGERYIKPTFEDIVLSTPGMSLSERESYVKGLYSQSHKPNLVKASYLANYEIDESKWHEDVRFMSGKEYCGQLDFLVGGSPCQSFSIMGKRKGFEEARGTLFYDFARMVDESKPKVFIFENVKGMLNHDSGRTWKVITEIFDDLGYKWIHWVLNAKKYGIPQNRERLFVVGFRDDLTTYFGKLEKPNEMDVNLDMSSLLESNIPNKYYLPVKGFMRVIDPNQAKHVALNGKIARCQVACQQYNWFGDMRFETDIPSRLENDERIHKGVYKGKRGVARCLTPRECLRLMGFGDDFKQVVPDQYMYRQCGNSIAVNVMEAVVKEIVKTGVFGNNKLPKSKELRIGTVFSGIGAPEFALKRLGVPHKVVFACDNGELPEPVDEETVIAELAKFSTWQEKKDYLTTLPQPKKKNFVQQSFMANYDLPPEHFHRNVRFLDGSQYKGQVDIFVGGSPCQSFTLLGYQKGLEEARGTLFYEFARLVKEIQPPVFIYENVQGLLKHDHGKTWEVVQRIFNTLGYKIHTKVLDACKYGLPQIRRRIFVVGFKNGGDNFEFPPETELSYTMQDFLLENTPQGNFKSSDGKLVLQHGRGNVPLNCFLSEKILPGILCEGTGGFRMKPEIDLPIARPLMSTMHKMHRAGEDNYVTTDGRVRRLAPRECLRLMGFTDDFKQVVSDTQMYRQAGNSMAVDVMMGLLSQIIKCL